MAHLLWGRVYYNEHYVGILNQEPGDKIVFSYDSSYLSSGKAPISHTLPLTPEPYVSFTGLLPFFDNLVSEGWLEQAQARLLGKRSISRFELLLAFGYDCAGAVYIIDPEPRELSHALMNIDDAKEMAILTSKASLSGIQPKLAITEKNGSYFTAKAGELSTHIAKFPSPSHEDLVINEYLTTLALQVLLNNDKLVKITLGEVKGISELALIIKRFDREQGLRLHFEEFTQLLGKYSKDKYIGSYKGMSKFIRETSKCLPFENYKLFTRIIAGLLLGMICQQFSGQILKQQFEYFHNLPVIDNH